MARYRQSTLGDNAGCAISVSVVAPSDGPIEPASRQAARISEPSAEHDWFAHQIVDSAFAVHTELGPGLLEPVYEESLAHELNARDVPILRQVALPIKYRNIRMDTGFHMDMVVGGLIVVEIKAIEKILPIHEAQLRTYLKLSGHRLGLLLNFNVVLIKHGIRRLIRSI